MPARAASDFPTRCLVSTCSSITWSGCECRLERPKGWKPSFRFRPRLPKVERDASCPPPGRWGSEEEKALGHSELGPCSLNFQANCFEEGIAEHPCSFPRYGPLRAGLRRIRSRPSSRAQPSAGQDRSRSCWYNASVGDLTTELLLLQLSRWAVRQFHHKCDFVWQPPFRHGFMKMPT
jgi:hypothetical protein